MKLATSLAAVLSFLIAACGESPTDTASPQEPGPGAVGHYCRMTLAEHKGPKGQILPRGWTEPIWFSSVRDALTYVEMDIVSDREMAGFWVNDMGMGTWEQPALGSWIEARKAFFVVGSAKESGMGAPEAVPFRERTAAEAFIKEFGGQIADYADARRHISSEAPTGDAPLKEGGT